MDPVVQCLPIHAADLRRAAPIHCTILRLSPALSAGAIMSSMPQHRGFPKPAWMQRSSRQSVSLVSLRRWWTTTPITYTVDLTQTGTTDRGTTSVSFLPDVTTLDVVDNND
jgi:hypothetical protein